MRAEAGGDRRAQALALLETGDARDALAILLAALDEEGEHPDLLGLLALAQDELGQKQAATEALERAVNLPADAVITLRNVANLVALLVESGRRPEAIKLLRRGWRWPSERKPERVHLRCVANLANAMNALGLYDECTSLVLSLLEESQLDWSTKKPLIVALAYKGSADEALRLAQDSLVSESLAHERHALLAYLYWKSGQRQASTRERGSYVKAAPPVLMRSRPTQKFTVGILEPNPQLEALIKPPHLHHFTRNYPWMMAKRQTDAYRFLSILMGASHKVIDQFNAANPRIIINNMVNAESLLSERNLENTNYVLSLLDAPVINPPNQAARCTRQMNAANLASVPGLIVPQVFRFPNLADHVEEIVEEIEKKTSYPFIIRTTDEQEARNTKLVYSRPEAKRALKALGRRQFYCIQYIGERRRENCFRRIRAAFIDGVPLIVRADYCDEWIVRSRNKLPLDFYKNHPKLFAETRAIIENPSEELGNSAIRTLENIGGSMPLDIFGLDFDVDDDGNVLFFEANATMNFFSNAPEEFPYPPQAETALKEALEFFLDSRAR